jgi:hypothetical protein
VFKRVTLVSPADDCIASAAAWCLAVWTFDYPNALLLNGFEPLAELIDRPFFSLS